MVDSQARTEPENGFDTNGPLALSLSAESSRFNLSVGRAADFGACSTSIEERASLESHGKVDERPLGDAGSGVSVLGLGHVPALTVSNAPGAESVATRLIVGNVLRMNCIRVIF